MPSRQQKSGKKGSERYFMFEPYYILATLSLDYGRSPGHENVCRWFLNKCKQLLGLTKLRNCVSWKMFEMELRFSKLVKIIVFRCLQTTKRLAAQGTVYALRNWQSKKVFVKQNEQKEKNGKKEI